MSSDRRLTYDKGPSLEDELEQPADADADETEQEVDGGDGRDGDDPASGATASRSAVDVAPWKAGLCLGIGAFATVFAVCYQYAGVMLAGQEDAPSRGVVAGITMLGNHGATVEEAGEAVNVIRLLGYSFSIVNLILLFVPMIVLALTGYLLSRYVRMKTTRSVGLGIGSLVSSYVALGLVLAYFSSWTPEEAAEQAGSGFNGDEPETIAVATDVSLFLTLALGSLVFVGIGCAIGAFPRLLERLDDASPGVRSPFN